MDSLNKATSSEGACASLSEGSTSEPHNSAFGTQHPCREKHFQFLTLQREQPCPLIVALIISLAAKNSAANHQHHLEVYDSDDPYVCGRGSFMWVRYTGVEIMAELSPRENHFSTPIVDKLYVWGGKGGFGKSVVTSIVHHYDPDSETWNTNTCEGPHPPGICDGACASAGHHLYTYGGLNKGWNVQGTLHLLDTRSRKWKLISSEDGPMKKRGSRMVVYDSKIVLFGGISNSGRTNELHTFNLKEGERLHIAMYPLMQFSCVAGVVVSNSDLDIERGIVCYTLALLIFGSNVSHSQVPIQTLFDTAVDVWACSDILPSPSQVHGPPQL